DPTTLRFSATLGGKTRPYVMDLDGKNKRELSKDYPHLVHGMSLSPDGKRGAYEDPAYRLFLADADGSNAKQVKTGERFHLMPSWSPDGAWVLFVAGEHYDCHPPVIQRDGVRQLYVMRLSDKKEHCITDLKKGHAAMWPHWQPRAAP